MANKVYVKKNGNVEEIDYLPIEAGGNNALTGDLHIDADGEDRMICIEDNGTIRFRINYATSSGNLVIGCYDDLFNSLSAVLLGGDGTLRLGTMGSAIYLRPSGGVFNSTNQIYFNSSGQQVGGHIFGQEADTSISVNLSANTWVNTKSVTGLDSGQYVAFGYVSFTPNSGSGRLSVGLGTNTTEGGQSITSTYYTGTDAVYLSVPFLAEAGTALRLWVKSTTAGKITLRRIRYTRIA